MGILSLLIACTFLLAACAEQTGGEGAGMDTTASADTMGGMMQDTSNMAMGGNGFTAKYSDLDQDANSEVSENEFMTGLQGQHLYDSWDLNNDAEITEDEFGMGLFNTWNENGDQYLTEDEFNAGSDVWLGDDYDYSYSDWDADGDLELTADEFSDGALGLGLFQNWDADGDGYIGEEDYYGGLYSTWDADGDGVLTEQEFNDASSVWYAGDNNMDGGSMNGSGDMENESM